MSRLFFSNVLEISFISLGKIESSLVMVPEPTLAILNVQRKMFYVTQIKAETLDPNHLRITEKAGRICLLPAGCNLGYQAEQRPNATNMKLEETQHLSLTFTLRVRTHLLSHISKN